MPRVKASLTSKPNNVAAEQDFVRYAHPIEGSDLIMTGRSTSCQRKPGHYLVEHVEFIFRLNSEVS